MWQCHAYHADPVFNFTTPSHKNAPLDFLCMKLNLKCNIYHHRCLEVMIFLSVLVVRYAYATVVRSFFCVCKFSFSFDCIYVREKENRQNELHCGNYFIRNIYKQKDVCYFFAFNLMKNIQGLQSSSSMQWIQTIIVYFILFSSIYSLVCLLAFIE